MEHAIDNLISRLFIVGQYQNIYLSYFNYNSLSVSQSLSNQSFDQIMVGKLNLKLYPQGFKYIIYFQSALLIFQFAANRSVRLLKMLVMLQKKCHNHPTIKLLFRHPNNYCCNYPKIYVNNVSLT